MNETMVCAVGNVATQPVYRDLANGASARFRLADGAVLGPREERLDGRAHQFLHRVGEPRARHQRGGIAVGGRSRHRAGQVEVRTEVREGQSWTSADIDAVAIGHDLSRGTSAFRRPNKEGDTTASPRP